MGKFLVRILTFISLMFVLGLVVGYFLPKDFTVTREVAVEASPETLYALIGDLERWPEWGPWKDADPSVEVTLGDKTTGVGASQSWTDKDGNGRLVFTEADPKRGVWFDLLFNDDVFVNTSSITFAESGETMVVTWEMNGSVPSAILGGYFAFLMPDMIGPLFEDGLAKLKERAEQEV
ncbi:SRPBCC family protein [Pelagicoccus mobilis]|uniref:SRPBCC family protein n=1 Tax=Pelagicoccus mobilis TaxID=415221 RepID=A0A934S1W9_9BACT|nr:SRPBCC family protein [Pelagicoccus mobilis]MBK1879539.1 SRPBCC family protein [Pelagicoccus mobilis]